MDEKVYAKIKNEMGDYLNSGGYFLNTPARHQITLLDMMEQYGIQIYEKEEKNWITAIRNTSEVLLVNNCINQNYINIMISLTRQYGPYFVISPCVAIAHAQPKDGVSKLGVSLGVYKKGLEIMGKAKVQFLFVLATPNQSVHLHILQNIAYLDQHEEVLNKILKAECEEDILSILQKMFEDDENL